VQNAKPQTEKRNAVFENSKTAFCRLEDFRARGIAREVGAKR
jgi:sulfur transfer complex TusBCD TusB component (DsrH family)